MTKRYFFQFSANMPIAFICQTVKTRIINIFLFDQGLSDNPYY